jgi:primary-amine oxidase
MVGPLPISKQTTIQPLDYIYQKPGTVPFNSGVFDKPRVDLYDKKINEVMCEIQDITMDLFGEVYCDEPSSTLTYAYSTPWSKDGSRSVIWVWFRLYDTKEWPFEASADTISWY